MKLRQYVLTRILLVMFSIHLNHITVTVEVILQLYAVASIKDHVADKCLTVRPAGPPWPSG